MAALPVVSGVTPMSGGQSLAEGLVAAINSQAQTLLDLKTSSLGILKATLSMKETLESNAASANLDSGTVEGNVQKKKDDGLSGKFADMLDSMQDAFDGLGTGTKSLLGIGALLAGLALLNTFSDELAELIAPILKFFNESFLPNLKELNQIILDQPGGYLTLLGVAGLTKTMFDIFGKGGKIAKVIDDTVDGVKVLKQVDLLDDLAVRKVTWATRLRTAFTGRMTGLFTKLGSMFTSIGTSLRALGAPLLDDLAVGLKQLTPTWLRVLKLQLLGGSTIYPIVAGGGKQIGLVGKVSQGIQSIVTSIRGLNPFAALAETLKTLTPTWLRVLKLQLLGGSTIYPITKGGGKTVGLVGKVSQGIQSIVTSIKALNPFAGLGATLKTLGASWKLALFGSLFGTAAGPAGAAGKAGVLTKVTGAITKIAALIMGIFSPASILGKFTKKIRGIFKIIGKTLGFVTKFSGLGAFLKLGLKLGKAIPVLGQIILIVQGIFGFIKGAIDGFKTGGIFGAITGGLIGLWDAIVGSLGNLIADILGWIFTKLGLEKFGAFLSNLDFSIDGIVDGFFALVDMIRGVIYNVVTGLKNFANDLFKIWNSKKYLPGTFDLFEIEEFEPLQRAKRTETQVYVPPEVKAPEIKKTDIQGFDADALMRQATGQLKADVAAGKLSEDDANILHAKMKGDFESATSESEALAALSYQSDSGETFTLSDTDTGEFSDAKIEELIDANQALIEKQLDAEDASLEKERQTMIINDNSSKSQMNNTQMVSTGLSVDATDLVAAKLNMMLPAFN
jgi:hypothetical protein